MSKKLQDNLMVNEKIIYQARFISPWHFVPIIIVFFFLLIGVFSLDSTIQEKLSYFFCSILMVAIASLIVIISGKAKTLAVTSKKIYGKTGIIKTNELESPLRQIQNVQVKQGLFNKITKLGTIIITTTTGAYIFKVCNPNEVKKAIMRQIEATEEDKMDTHAEKIADAIYKKNR